MTTVRVLVAILPQGVGGYVVDGIGSNLRCVDEDVARECTIDDRAIRKIMALVVVPSTTPAASGREQRKPAAGQKEMLMPISGKKQSRETAAKKPAAKPQRKAA